jgi:predicted NUDIX family NTP pyrophosphohydrolase
VTLPRAKQSAGILLYRIRENRLQVMLVHPGGPFWVKKDLGAWSIPKGEYTGEEDPLTAAKREFHEELGTKLPDGNFISLGNVTQKGGKVVCAWAFKHDLDVSVIHCNTIFIDWPPRSGKKLEIPEVDRAEWFSTETAKEKINPAQVEFISRLEKLHIAE